MRLEFTLFNVDPVAEQFSTVGGVRQFLLMEATILSLVGYCRRTIGYSISGVVEGSLAEVHSFSEKMKALKTAGRIEAVISSLVAVLEASFTDFSILKNQTRGAVKGPDSDQEDKFEKGKTSVSDFGF